MVQGKVTPNAEKSSPYTDITRQQFGRLTALYPTQKRSHSGSVVWHCQCTCGKELDASYNDLVYGSLCSCGCRKKEHDQKLRTFLTHVDGTCINMLKSDKLPANNTTGVKGVYFNRGRYLAKIVFQKKQYCLGHYSSLEEAATARRLAETTINTEVVAFYEKWSQRAAQDKTWAIHNPIRIHVSKAENQDLQVILEPALE